MQNESIAHILSTERIKMKFCSNNKMEKNIIRRYPDRLEVTVSNLHKTDVMYCDPADEKYLSNRCFLTGSGYAAVNFGGKMKQFHRVVFDNIPDGMTVDHIDRNRLNNRRSNLRLANKREQNINRVLPKSRKELPPGISVKNDHDYHAQDVGSFTASEYGRRGALKSAMNARMLYLITSDDHVSTLFPPEIIERAIAEVGSNIPLYPLKVALGALREMGYNLWKIPYGGMFADYVEKEDWSFSATKRYVLKTVTAMFDHLEAHLSPEELKCESLLLESDVRAFNYLYTSARRAEGHRRKEPTRELAKQFAELDDILAKFRTGARLSLDTKPQNVVTSSEAIASAKEIIAKVATEKDIIREEAALEESEVEQMMSDVMTKTLKVAAEDTSAAQKVMEHAMRGLEKIVNPPEPKAQRAYKVSAHTTSWVANNLIKSPGSAVLTKDVLDAYERSSGSEGKIKLNFAIKTAGYLIKPQTSIIDCRLK